MLNSMQAISLLDFSVKPAVNTYTGNSNIAAKPSAYLSSTCALPSHSLTSLAILL